MFDNMHKVPPEFEAALEAMSELVCLNCGAEGTDTQTCDRCGKQICDSCSPERDDDSPIDICEECCQKK